MLSLTDRASVRAAARDPTLDPPIRAVLRLRLKQLGDTGADFHVVTARDTVADVEAAVGFPLSIDGEPCWEWSRRHPGCTELTFILSDDGHAQVVILPDRRDIDAELTAIVRALVAEESADGVIGEASEPASTDRA